MARSFNEKYEPGGTGEVAGSATAKQLPDLGCKLAKLKAQKGNAGSVYLGFADTVTVAGGSSDDVTSGFELEAGEETDWLPIANLNQLWIICDNAGDDLSYIYFT